MWGLNLGVQFFHLRIYNFKSMSYESNLNEEKLRFQQKIVFVHI